MGCRTIEVGHDLPRPSKRRWKKATVVCCRECGKLFAIAVVDASTMDQTFYWKEVNE